MEKDWNDLVGLFSERSHAKDDIDLPVIDGTVETNLTVDEDQRKFGLNLFSLSYGQMHSGLLMFQNFRKQTNVL